MLKDGISEDDIKQFIKLQNISSSSSSSSINSILLQQKDNIINNKVVPSPPPPPPKVPIIQSTSTTKPPPPPSPPPKELSFPRPPPPPPPPQIKQSISISPVTNNDSIIIKSPESILSGDDDDNNIITNRTPFSIAKRKGKHKDYTNIEAFRENIETILYTSEAQCAQLEAVLSFNEISISEIMIKIESYVKDIKIMIDRDIVPNDDKFRLKELAEKIELTLNSHPPLNANSQYQHLDKMRFLNQRAKDTISKLNQLITYLSQSSLSQIFVESLEKEIATHNIGHFSSLESIQSKLELLYRNLVILQQKMSNLLRPNAGFIKLLENRISEKNSYFLNSNFLLNYIDPNDGLSIGSLLIRAASITLLTYIYSTWTLLIVL